MYYIQDGKDIIFYNENRQILEDTLLFIPQHSMADIQETDRNIVEFECKYYFEDDEEFQELKKAKEKERISNLTMTKRVFALGLQEYGISYTQLKELIATNEQAQLEWDLCVELQRNNPLLDNMAQQMGITPEQLDQMFIQANSENPAVM